MHCHMQMKKHSPTYFNWMYDTNWNLSGRKVFFSVETNKITLTFKNDRRKVDRSNHDVSTMPSVCRFNNSFRLSLQTETVVPRFVQE